MEDYNMEEEKYKDIELRSEEVQEVMNRVPPAILRYGIGILASIVVVLLSGSALFRYPETVQVAVTVSTRTPPAYIKCTGGGKLERLYVTNGQAVKKGDVLAVMENVASTEDILRLKECLASWQAKGARPERLEIIFFHRLPKLGNVQGAYASCLLAWNNYLQHAHENRIHETELNNAVTQLMTALSEWEKLYLPVAPITGQVAFMQLWKSGQYVNTGENLFVIVPDGESEFVGKALLPMLGSGKVRTGQRVVVSLTGFPEQEYGRIEGEVISISPVPDEEGNYVVEIRLTHMTSKRPPLLKVMNGTAEIIVREQSLLEKIFTH